MRTIIFDQDVACLEQLSNLITTSYSSIAIIGKYTRVEQFIYTARTCSPDILVLDLDSGVNGFDIHNTLHSLYSQTIFTASSDQYVINAIQHGVCGYLVKPFVERELYSLLNHCINYSLQYQHSMQLHARESQKLENQDLICIPTIEGVEIMQASEIIRFEGLQKCTRIVTKDRSDIISSYSIGIFREMLEGLCFIQPHKSHLVNLRFIKRFLKEGSIIMKDNTVIPVSRRKRSELFKDIRQPHRQPIVQ